MLLGKYEQHHVAVYLLLVGHLQETHVYDQTPALLEALGLSAADAKAYAEKHAADHPPEAKAEGAA